MNNLAVKSVTPTFDDYWSSLLSDLGETLAANGQAHDRDGSFVSENYELLKRHRCFSAGENGTRRCARAARRAHGAGSASG